MKLTAIFPMLSYPIINLDGVRIESEVDGTD
jgi:hypothetical protein